MNFRFKSKLILAKTHVTYPVDPVPTEGANAILTSNLSVQPYEGDRVTRELDKVGSGNDVSFNVGAHVVVEFDVELAGSSGIDTAPAYGPLKTACRLEETVTITTGPIEYDPESLASGLDAVAIYFNADGQQQIILGCRGSMSFQLTKGQIPKYHYRFLGIYARPTAVAQYNPSFGNFILPQPVNKQNTLTADFDGFSAVMESFQFDQNNVVIYRNLPGSESVEITDHDPQWQAVIEAPAIGTKDFYALVESHDVITQFVMQIAHGKAATNRVTIDGAQVQLQTLTSQDSDGVKMYALSGIFPPSSAGNDDYKITVTGP